MELPGLGILQPAHWETKHQGRVFRRHPEHPYWEVSVSGRASPNRQAPHYLYALSAVGSGAATAASPAEMEARQLAAELLGGPVNDRDINRL